MTTNAGNGHDEIDELDDEATLAASDDAVAEIRAQAARVRGANGGFNADDPTTVMSAGDVSEPTIIRDFDPATDVTLIPAASDTTPGTFDAGDDPTTVMAPAQALSPTAPAPVADSSSLIEGKAPPTSDATYWQGGEQTASVEPVSTPGKGPVPVWFLATSVLAVLMAVGLVLLVLWALSGSSV